MEPFQRMERGRLLMAFLACDACRCLRERTQPRRADSRSTLAALAVAAGLQPCEGSVETFDTRQKTLAGREQRFAGRVRLGRVQDVAAALTPEGGLRVGRRYQFDPPQPIGGVVEFRLQLPTNVVCCGRRRPRRLLNA